MVCCNIFGADSHALDQIFNFRVICGFDVFLVAKLCHLGIKLGKLKAIVVEVELVLAASRVEDAHQACLHVLFAQQEAQIIKLWWAALQVINCQRGYCDARTWNTHICGCLVVIHPSVHTGR